MTKRKFYCTTTKEEMEMELGFHEFQGEKEREKTHKILQCRETQVKYLSVLMFSILLEFSFKPRLYWFFSSFQTEICWYQVPVGTC